MKDFSKQITEKIKEDCIVPDSKWKNYFKNYSFWGAFFLVISLGALFLSLIILNVTDLGPELIKQLKLRKFLFLVFLTMPYLWIGLLLITIFFGFMVFRKTKRGYRYNVLFVFGAVVLSIAILGALAHLSKINRQVNKGIPGPEKLVRPMEGRWQRPEEGLLGGEIINVESAKIFLIKTPKGEDWKIIYSDDTKIKNSVKIETGERVGMLGEKKDGYIFEAFIIMQPPFGGKIHVKGIKKSDFPKCFHKNCSQGP